MPLHRLAWLVVLCVLGMALVWADYAWGHRRTHGPLWQDPRDDAKTQTSPDLLLRLSAEQPSEPASGQFSKLVPQGGQGTIVLPSSANLLKTINVCATGPERLAAFFEMAYQAEAHGHIDLAIKVYTLAASLYPNTPLAERARLKRFTLEFYLDLGGADPCLAFKNFLAKLSGLATRFSREELREPLVAGWTMVEQTIRNRLPCPISLVEKALTLWEMHPPGTHPPEAALLLGRLLKDQGLLEEAADFFTRARDQGAGQVRTQALVELLQLAWVSQGLPGFLNTLKCWQEERRELVSALKTWRLELAPPGDGEPNLPLKTLAGFKELLGAPPTSPCTKDRPSAVDLQLWEVLLSQPLPVSLQEYLVRSAAQLYWSQGEFTKAGKLYRDMLARVADKESSIFYWDRLGLAHMQERQPDLAQDIFHALAKEQGQFWPLVAHTRQLDLELSRLMAEPAS